MILRLLAMTLSLAVAAPAAAPTFAFAQEELSEKPKPKPKKKKKGYDYERSKYKSRDLAADPEHSYRFNERGEPILPKKKGAKKKVRSEPPDADKAPAACGGEEACAAPPKNPEADAL